MCVDYDDDDGPQPTDHNHFVEFLYRINVYQQLVNLLHKKKEATNEKKLQQ